MSKAGGHWETATAGGVDACVGCDTRGTTWGGAHGQTGDHPPAEVTSVPPLQPMTATSKQAYTGRTAFSREGGNVDFYVKSMYNCW